MANKEVEKKEKEEDKILGGLEQLEKYLSSLEGFELPSYRELPTVKLYMEQVLEYVNHILAPFSEENKGLMTSFMVNNYVKAKILKEPDGKRYGVEQLGYLMAIAILKRSLSMAEVGRLFEMDGGISASKSDIYDFYRVLLKDLVEERVSFLSSKCEDVRHHFEKEKEEGKEDADINAAYQVALLAFRLAVRSAIDPTLAKAMIASLGPSSSMDNHFLWKAGKEEEKEEEKNVEKEAKRLGERKVS